MTAPMISHPVIRAASPQLAIGQIGGHVKMGFKHPRGQRTGKTMALVSALPLSPGSDQLVLAFMDRSDPHETFDYLPHKGDNAVVIVPKLGIGLSVINGVCPGDWKGAKVALGEPIAEPVDLDVDPTGLDVAASDRWVDLVDELGCDCSKLGGYPLWSNAPLDIDSLVGRPQRFHHRLSGDLVDMKLGDGGVVYVFVDEDGTAGSLCWQQAK
ncbi:MAG: hypothetical protein H0V44_13620 [Planctomycetes bacterium]|nr:hypothetical protein [Planctomycetota bacterium]